MAKSSKKKNQPASRTIQTLKNPKTTSTPVVSTEVNVAQSSESLGTKKKGKNKSKKSENQEESNNRKT